MSTQTTRSGTIPYALVSLALLISTACKLWLLNSRELWLDETYSAYLAGLRFKDCFRSMVGDVHPPLYSFLLWSWVQLFGIASTHLRCFSVVLSLFAGIAMFFLAKRLMGAWAGVLATTLFTFSPTLFVYSLEVRSYMLFLLVFVCLLKIHWQVAVEQVRGRRVVALYAILAATLFYTHYLAVIVLTTLLIHWLAVSRFERGRLTRIAIVGGLIVLLVAPGVPLLLSQRVRREQLDKLLIQSHTNPQSLSAGDTLGEHTGWKTLAANATQNVAALAGVYPARSHLFLALGAIPLALVFGGTVFLWLFRKDPVCGLVGIFVPVFLCGLLLGAFANHRYYLPLVPLFAIAIARTVQLWTAAQPARIIAITAAALTLVIYLAGFHRQATMKHGHPWTDLVSTLKQRAQPGDTVIFSVLYAQVPYDYFARQQGLQLRETGFPLSIYDWWNQQPFKGWGGPVILRSDLDSVRQQLAASHSPTVWVVTFENYYYDPQNALVDRMKTTHNVSEIPLPQDPDDRGSPPSDPRLFMATKK